jgi:hypothetical protein
MIGLSGGWSEQGCHNRLSGQDCYGKRQPGQNRKERTSRKKDSQNRTARAGQAGQNSQNKTA